MAEILLRRQAHPPVLFPGVDPLPPFRRGPMYSAYAELRDWRLRMKKAGLSPSTPIPIFPLKKQAPSPPTTAAVPDHTMSFVKESRKPPPSAVQRSDASLTPSWSAKPELRRVGSFAAGKTEEKRSSGGGGSPGGGGGAGQADEFLLMRSFSSYQETKEISMATAAGGAEDGRGGRRSGGKGIFRKTITGFRRSSFPKATS
ncbi:hypothetical protein AXF42_Ash014139 [Apostasia shenzhenica]|uniref:Uncharacterized protein n=1 Tax=Apostasia shenzhenica TaxID=1088818 RepID=A0A2I0A120_9ASPA|nr:hypothetical protein AXF42_Ash014139 [Apostasia shenzhenica]